MLVSLFDDSHGQLFSLYIRCFVHSHSVPMCSELKEALFDMGKSRGGSHRAAPRGLRSVAPDPVDVAMSFRQRNFIHSNPRLLLNSAEYRSLIAAGTLDQRTLDQWALDQGAFSGRVNCEPADLGHASAQLRRGLGLGRLGELKADVL
jgi:hypothetical protein